MKHYYIKNNLPEIRQQLEQAGYKICHCASYFDSKWLSVYPKDCKVPELAMSVHGLGYGCEDDCKGKCPNKCIMCSISKDDGDIHIFSDAESYLEYINVE